MTQSDIVRDADFEGKILDPGLPAAISPISVEQVVSHYERYTSGISNRFFRTLHSLERSQRIRQGENVPAPVAVDVSVLAETVTRESAHAEPQQPSPVPIEEGETAAAPAIVDVTDAAPGVVDSPPADSEHESLPEDGKHFAALNAVEVTDGETGKVLSAPTAWSPKDRSRPIWDDR